MRLTVFYWTSTKSRAKRRFISSFYRGFNWTSFVSNTNLFRIFLLYGKRTNFRKGGIMSNQCRTCQLRMVLLSLCITYTHVRIIPRLLMKDLVIWCQDTWYHDVLLTRHFRTCQLRMVCYLSALPTLMFTHHPKIVYERPGNLVSGHLVP